MNRDEAALLLSAKFLQIHSFLKRTSGDSFANDVAPFRAVLTGVAKQRKVPLISALTQLSKEMDAAGQDPSWLVAAFIEEAKGGGA